MKTLYKKVKFYSLVNNDGIKDLILKNNPWMQLSEIDFELLIVIGGDGTFLSAIQAFHHFNIDIIFYNHGNLGFFSDEFNNFIIDYSSLKFEAFPLLKTQLNNQIFYSFNELIFESLKSSIDLKINLNKINFYKYSGSGFMINTSNGSTGINRSFNGPLFFNNQMYCFSEYLTNKYKNFNEPINQPIILNINHELDIKINDQKGTDYYLIKNDGYPHIIEGSIKSINISLIMSNAKINTLNLVKWIKKINNLLLR